MAEQKAANGGSQVMEERIVAAKFDSSDFEKGVDRTVKKLDELKKSLNLKDTGKSITEIGDKTKEATESASKSLEKLTDRFTTFSGMVKQKLLSGIADQVVNAFFRMERAVLSFAKSMTFDQISNGLGKYEEALTSVRMIVNSYKTVKNEITGVNEKIHYTQEEAYASIHTLQKYADETSYSMSQMTDAMSKMVAAGVDMDTATKNVQGIANACAAAGVNAQEASRAFYNLSQAYSSGALKYTDYRSLELLNMTNENFQDQLLAAGVASGTLKEVKGKNGTVQYKTQKSKTNGKVTAGKTFTRQGLTDSLRYGWADNNVMNQLFGSNFYVDVQDFLAAEDQYDEKEWKNFNGQQKTEARKKYLASLKDLDAIETYINKLGDKNVTKEILKSKTTSEEKEEYLKSLSDQADELNEVARKYAKVDDTDIKNYLNGLEDDDEHKVHYKELKTDKERKEYLKQLKNDETFIKDVKGKAIGYDEAAVKSYIEALDDSDERKKKYMDMDEKQRKQYIKDLITEAEGLGKISKKYSDITIQSFLAAREARNLSDVINAVGDYVSSKWTKVFENLIGTLEDASDFFTELSEGGIASIFTDFADWAAAVSDTFAETDGSKAFRDIITEIDSALGNLFGIFNDLSPETSEFGWTLSVIASKISVTVQEFNTWTERVRYWFKEVERAETIKTIFANLSGVFTIGARLITTAFGTIGKALEVVAPILDAVFVALSEITKPIGELGSLENNEPFTKLSEAIDNFFRVISPVSEGLAEPIKVIGGFLGTIGEFFLQGAIDTLVANITLLGDTIAFFLELFAGPSDVLNEEGKKIGEVYDKGSKQAEEGRGVIQGIITDVNNLKNTLSSALGTVSGFFDNLFIDLRKIFNLKQEEGADVQDGGLFANVKNFFDTNEFIKKAEEWLANAKTDIVTWFDNAVKSMQTWIGNLPKTIDDFFSSVFSNTSKETENGNDESVKESAEGTISPFKTWLLEVKTNFDGWFEQAKVDIKTWIKDVPNKLNQFFTGFLYQEDTSDAGKYVKEHYGKTAYVETPLKKWLDSVVESVSNFVANIPGYLLKAIGKIGDIFVFVVDALFGAAEETNDTKKNPKNERSAAAVANNWGTTFVEKIKEAIKSIPEQVTTFIAEMKGRFKKALGTIKTWFKESENGKAITEFGQSIITGIKKFILNLPTTIKNLIKSIGSTGRNIISWVKELFGNGDVGDEIQNELEKEVKGISLGSILSSIADIGVTIANEVLSLFTGTDDLESNINWFISTVIGFITSIPGRFWDEAQRIGTSISEVWEYIMGQLTSDGDTDKSDGASNAEEFAKKHPVLKQTIDAAIKWIQGIPDRFQEAYRGLSSRINKVWSDIETIVGRNDRLAEINELLNDAGDDLRSDDKRALEEEKTRLEADTDFEKNHPIIAGLVSSAVQWINNLPDTLTDAWETAKETISTFWKGFTAFWNKSDRTRSEIISDMRHYDPGSEQYKALEEELDTLHKAEDFEKAHPQLASWVNTARDWISSIPETLDGVWQTASTGITKVWKDFTDFWNKSDRMAQIDKQLSGPSALLTDDERKALTAEYRELEKGTDFERNHPKLAGIITSARNWIRDIPKNLNATFTQLQEDWNDFWKRFLDFIKADPAKKENTEFAQNYPFLAGIIAPIQEWIEHLPENLEESFNSVKGNLEAFFNDFSDYWDKLNKKSALTAELKTVDPKSNRADEINKELAALDGSATNFEKNHSILATAVNGLHGWLMSIPETVSTAFHSATESLTNFWNDLVAAFNGENINEGKDPSELTFGDKLKEKIVNFFAELPATITNAINDALGLLTSGIDSLTGLLSGAEAEPINIAPDLTVDDFGAKVKQKVEDALKTVGDATEEVTEEVTKSTEKVADEANKDSPKPGFVDGIVNIGKSIWTIITKTIPNFIKAGFQYIGEHKEEWIDGLYTMFTNVTGIEIDKIDLSTIGTSIEEAIKNLPQTIENAWGKVTETVGHLFGGNKKPLETGKVALLEGMSISDDDKKQLLETWKKEGYDVSKYVDDPSLWDSFLEAGKSIGGKISEGITWAVNNIGPLLITAWNNSMSFIDKIFTGIGNWFSGGGKENSLGDELAEPFGDDIEQPVKDSINGLGTSIENFIKKIPSFIGSGLAYVVHAIPDLLGSFLESFTKTWDELDKKVEDTTNPDGGSSTNPEKEAQKKTGTFTEILQNIASKLSGVFNSVLGFLFDDKGQLSFQGHALIIIGLFALIATTLTNLINSFRISNRAADKWEAKNNIEGFLNHVLNTMMVMMVVASYAAQLSPEQFENFDNTLDKILGYIDKILNIYMIYKAADLLGNDAGVFDLARKLMGVSSDGAQDVTDAARSLTRQEKLLNTGTSLVSKFGSMIETLMTSAGIAGGIEMIGNATTDVISTAITEFTGNFTEIGAAIDTFSSEVEPAMQRISSIETYITTVLEVMGKILDVIDYMKRYSDRKGDVQMATTVIRKIRLAIGSLGDAFEGNFKTTELIQALHDIMGMTGEMETFSNFVKAEGNPFGVFKEAIASLGSAMSFYDGVNLDSTITTTGIENAITILKSILENDDLLGLASKLTPEQFGADSTEMFETSERIIIFATALAKIGTAFKGFDSTAAEGFKQFVQTVNDMSFKDVMTTETPGEEDAGLVGFAEKMSALGDGLSAFALAIGDFEEADVKNAEYALNMVEGLAEKLDDVGKGFLAKVFTGGTDLTTFSNQLSVLGTNLQSFMTAMHPIADANGKVVDWDFRNIIAAMYALNKVAEAASTITGGTFIEKAIDVSKLKELLSTDDNIGTLINTFITNLSKDFPDEVDYTKVAKALSTFSDFTQSLSNLQGININKTIKSLTADYTYTKNKTWDIHDINNTNGLYKFVTVLSLVYRKISSEMNAIYTEADDGHGKGDKKIQIEKVKAFFETIGDFFKTMQDLVVKEVYEVGTTGLTTEYRNASIGISSVMENMITAMKTLSDNTDVLFGMIDAVGGYQFEDRLERAKQIISMIREMSIILQMFGSTANTTNSPLEGIYALEGIDSDLAVEGITKLVGIIDDLTKTPYVISNLHDSGRSMAQYLAEGIQSAFDSGEDIYTPTIRPIFDDESIKTQMASLFGTENTAEFNISTGFTEAVRQAFGGSETLTNLNTAVGEIRDDVRNNLSDINNQMDSLRTEIGELQNAFDGISMYLDSGELVGAIGARMHEYIDSRIDLYVRHVTQ